MAQGHGSVADGAAAAAAVAAAAAAAIVTQDFSILEAGEKPQMAPCVFVPVIRCRPSCSEASRADAAAS